MIFIAFGHLLLNMLLRAGITSVCIMPSPSLPAFQQCIIRYIVTTKSTEFVQVILRSWGVTSFDSARIFGLGSGPKIETIHRLVMAHEAEVTAALGHAADHVRAEGRLVPVRAHFFEDKLSTLVESAEHPLSKKIDVRFYLARWGCECLSECFLELLQSFWRVLFMGRFFKTPFRTFFV